MTKTVYIWYIEPSIFRDSDYSSHLETALFVSETIADGEKEFSKRYSDFSIEDYTFTDESNEPMYCWAVESDMLIQEEEG